MTILNNEKKSIKLSFTDEIKESADKKHFSISLPTIVCSDKQDAEYMQQKINTFVNNLSHDILDE